MAETEDKRGPGRPPIEINAQQLEGLAQIHCTQEDIALVLGMSKRTLINKLKEPEFAEAYERGKAKGRSSLRKLQWEHARRPNSAGVSMTIHLSKHWLGETEKAALEVSGRIDSAIEVSVRDRISAKFDTLHKRIEGGVAKLAEQAGARGIPADTD